MQIDKPLIKWLETISPMKLRPVKPMTKHEREVDFLVMHIAIVHGDESLDDQIKVINASGFADEVKSAAIQRRIKANANNT